MNTRSHYDVAIIGAGMSGLAAGIRLAHQQQTITWDRLCNTLNQIHLGAVLEIMQHIQHHHHVRRRNIGA